MPVTHRIIEIEPVPEIDPLGPELSAFAPDAPPALGADGIQRLVTMQGDDNDTPDALPYLISDGRRVMFSAPHLGAALMLIQSPIGMGSLVLLVAALTVWAFWPKRVATLEAEESNADKSTVDEDHGSAQPRSPRHARVT